jgi:hypothetical protein
VTNVVPEGWEAHIDVASRFLLTPRAKTRVEPVWRYQYSFDSEGVLLQPDIRWGRLCALGKVPSNHLRKIFRLPCRKV